MSLNRRQEAIRDICVKRNIIHLCHFTPVNNLLGILEYGLKDREQLDHDAAHGFSYVSVDPDRLDGERKAVCLSVMAPNSRMMRYKSGRGPFVVLLLDPRILWVYTCAFCFHNAAANMVKKVPLKDRLAAVSLEGLFQDPLTNSYKTRERENLLDSDPTSEQAEVLCYPSVNNTGYLSSLAVEPFFIREVHVRREEHFQQIEEIAKEWQRITGRKITCSGDYYFQARDRLRAGP